MGEVGLDIPPPPPRPEKICGQIYHNGVGVLSSSTYKIDLLADKQKKKGGEGRGLWHIFPRPENYLWQDYHNGLRVLSSSMYMTGLWADKQKKKKKKKKKKNNRNKYM